MKRDFKFRTWCGNDFIYFDLYNDSDTDFHQFCSIIDQLESPIEAYTGFKDRNDKEIYEGDIVTLNGEWEEIEYSDCSVITFKDGCYRVGDGYDNEAGIYLADWRIIGNIHANPELLKEKRKNEKIYD